MMEVKRVGEGVHGDRGSPLDTPGEVNRMRGVQNEYIRNADITPICNDMRNAYMNELSEIGGVWLMKIEKKNKETAYLKTKR